MVALSDGRFLFSDLLGGTVSVLLNDSSLPLPIVQFPLLASSRITHFSACASQEFFGMSNGVSAEIFGLAVQSSETLLRQPDFPTLLTFLQERCSDLEDREVPPLADAIMSYFPYVCRDLRVSIRCTKNYIDHANILGTRPHITVVCLRELCKCVSSPPRPSYGLQLFLPFLVSMVTKFFLLGIATNPLKLVVQDPMLALHTLIVWEHYLAKQENFLSLYTTDQRHAKFPAAQLKSWLELAQYCVWKRSAVRAEPRSHLQAGKFLLCTKVAHRALGAVQQRFFDKGELVQRFRDSLIGCSHPTRIDPDTIKAAEKIYDSVSRLEILSSLFGDARGLPKSLRGPTIFYLGYVLYQMLTISGRTGLCEMCIIPPSRISDLVSSICKSRNLEDEVRDYCVPRLIQSNRILASLTAFISADPLVRDAGTETVCYRVLSHFPAVDLLVKLSLRFARVSWLCFVDLPAIAPHSQFAVVDPVFARSLLQSNEEAVHDSRDDVERKSQTAGILLNVAPKKIRAYLRANLLSHETRELGGLVHAVAQFFLLTTPQCGFCDRHPKERPGEGMDWRRIVGVSDVRGMIGSVQRGFAHKADALAEVLERRLRMMNVSLVSRHGRKAIFRINSARLKSYCKSPGPVLAHFQDASGLKSFILDVAEICALKDDPGANHRNPRGDTRKRLCGSVLKTMRLCWFLRVVGKVLKYRHKISHEDQDSSCAAGTHVKLLNFTLKLRHFEDLVRIPRIYELAIPELAFAKDASPDDFAVHAIGSLKLYFEEVLTPPRNFRKKLAPILEDLKNVFR